MNQDYRNLHLSEDGESEQD